jgi:hypothetical protein
MKKKIILAALLVSNFAAVKSQTLTIGPRVGINISSLSNREDMKAKVGLSAGGFAMYSFVENFGVGIDALYSREGAQYVYEIKDGDDLTRYKYHDDLNYLRFNIPVTYFFRKKEDSFRPKIFAGPSLAFLLSAKNKSELISSTGNSNVTIRNSTMTVTDQYKRTDFGALIGAGFNVKLAEAIWFDFDAAYHIGAVDIPKNTLPGADPIHNQGFSLLAGVGFGF